MQDRFINQSKLAFIYQCQNYVGRCSKPSNLESSCKVV